MSVESAPNIAQRTVIKVDPFIPGIQQQNVHNRWHPDIPAVATVKPGEVFKVECVDWSGGQIGNNDSCDDLTAVDLGATQNLSGPIAVDGAEAGDYLVIDILNVIPFERMPWGYTGSHYFGGSLPHGRDLADQGSKAIWDFDGVFTSSRHIRGVRFAGIPHSSVIGTAPSRELLHEWHEREQNIHVRSPNLLPPRFGPDEGTAHVGQNLPPDVMSKIKREGAQILAGREHGGNRNIKNLSRGSRCYFPVFVKGANLSIGDLNFSQGDGKISLFGGIKMAGIITLKAGIIKNGIEKFALKQPMSAGSPVNPLYSQKLCFQGLSVNINGDGKQHFLDTTVGFTQAALNAVRYFMKIGYTREQAYLLLSAAPIESHIAAIVNRPNVCVTLEIPTGIFNHDILPKHGGFIKQDFGQCAVSGAKPR